ncbi:hypothetical protein M9H77_23176 [Catharanthus roseus]|uniref:Uncharacterized protein n=1 Tax=Catharanthus roseus TaxID=4058 RepID=A0ACC0AS98_CATRO|nr:hypothetical protein M9H77_23176 [Catharanthus roseus]
MVGSHATVPGRSLIKFIEYLDWVDPRVELWVGVIEGDQVLLKAKGPWENLEKDEVSKEKEYELEKSESTKENEYFIEKQESIENEQKEKEVVALDKSEDFGNKEENCFEKFKANPWSFVKSNVCRG